MNRALLLASALVVLGAGPPAAAREGREGNDEWAASFTPKAVAGYVKGGAILVAAAGGDASAHAADALRVALRTDRRLVMDEGAVGDTAKLDDQAIVHKAAALPVASVAVVRVFAAGSGENAVVTVYDKKGQVLSAFTAERGSPLTARGSAAVEGVSAEAEGAVSSVLKRAPDRNAAQDQYDREYIGFYHVTAFNQYGAMVASWTTPFEGKFQRELEMGRFYEKVGRADYAQSYRSKRRTKIALLASGAAVSGVGLLGGLGVMMAGLLAATPSTDCFGDPNCTPTSHGMNTGLFYAGLGMMGGGVVVGTALMIAGGVINPNPIVASEAHELAERYNRDLRQRLGLPPEERSSSAGGLQLSIAPTVGPGGAGLALSAIF